MKFDEEIASGKAEEAQTLKNECESDLAEAIPALEAALSALDTLKASVGMSLCFISDCNCITDLVNSMLIIFIGCYYIVIIQSN